MVIRKIHSVIYKSQKNILFYFDIDILLLLYYYLKNNYKVIDTLRE